MDELRSSPDPEDVPDPRLHLVLHYEVLPAEDVRHAEQGIIDGPGERQHRAHSVAVADARMVQLCDPEQYAIPEGRVRVRHVCLEPDNGLPLGVFAGEHRLPHRDRLVHALDAVDAGFHRLAVLAERLGVALADVGLARREELLRPLVVQGDAVALVEDLVELDAGPVQTFPTWSNASGRRGLSSDPIVSSKTRRSLPWYFFAYASFRTNARAFPMWRGPLGYGARRRTTLPSTAFGSGGSSFGPTMAVVFSRSSGAIADSSRF